MSCFKIHMFCEKTYNYTLYTFIQSSGSALSWSVVNVLTCTMQWNMGSNQLKPQKLREETSRTWSHGCVLMAVLIPEMVAFSMHFLLQLDIELTGQLGQDVDMKKLSLSAWTFQQESVGANWLLSCCLSHSMSTIHILQYIIVPKLHVLIE